MTKKVTGIAVVAVLLLGACASVPPSRNPGRISDLVEMINGSEPAELTAQSRIPFLFGTELVSRASDVEMIWSSLKDSGAIFSEEGETMAAQSGDYHRLANSFDLEVFFSRDSYLPEDAMWVPLASPLGSFDLLVGGEEGRLPMILGIVRVDR